MNPVVGEDIMEEVGVASLVLATGHAYFNKEGKFDMNSLLLQQLLVRFPDLDRIFADILYNRHKHRKEYNMLVSSEIINYLKEEGVVVGLFQNRIKPGDIPNLDLIKRSVRRVNFWAENYERIAIEYPDMTGKLDRDDVMDVMDGLASNVWLYIPNVEVAVVATANALPRGIPADIHRR
jgi:hypothetical protein